MERTITGFHADEEGHWVAELSCGHARHVRHNPPWQVRPWVLTREGRASHLDTVIECVLCGRMEMPESLVLHLRTAELTGNSIPEDLRKGHETAPATWVRIQVVEGLLTCRLLHPISRDFTVDAASPLSLPPGALHHLRALGPVRFYLEFFRPPEP